MLIAALATTGACTTAPSALEQSTVPDRSAATHPAAPALDAALRELEASAARGDWASVAALYADDAVLLGPGGARTAGRAAIDAYWERSRPDARWTLTSASIEGDPRLPIQRGRSVLSYAWEDGRRSSEVEFLLVWRLESDGAYRIVVDAYWRDPAPE